VTRDEAIDKVKKAVGHFDRCVNFVEALSVLGLLKFETTADKDRIAAAERLRGMYTVVDVSMAGANRSGKITEAGAYEILDILTKSGFKIMREPT
jgi:hypothetical protein